jgi:hypothetical protein
VTCAWDDDFTGDDTDPPDTNKWTGGAIGTGIWELQGNKLRMGCGSGGGNSSNSRHLGNFVGDFDFQIDVDGVLTPNSSGWQLYLLAEVDSTHYYYISMWQQIGSPRWQAAYRNGNGTQYPDFDARGSTVGALRLTRTGSTVRCYYDEDRTGSWVELDAGGEAIGSGNVILKLSMNNWTGYPAATVDVDNLIINTGCPGGIPGITTSTTTTHTTSTTSTTTTEAGNTYSTNFTGYTPDVAPDDFTEVWEAPVAALTVKDDDGQYGGRYLLIDHNTFGHFFAEWDDVGLAKDVDVLAKVQFNDLTPVDGDDYFKIVVRQTGGNSDKNGYELRLRPYNDDLFVYKWVNNTPTQIGPTGYATLSTYWYWVRFQVRENAVKAKVWAGQPSDEPGAWDIEVTDAAHAGVYGTVGLGSYNGDETNVDYYAVGVGGSDAPAPADYLTTTTTTTTTTATTTTGTTESPMDPATYISTGTLQSG